MFNANVISNPIKYLKLKLFLRSLVHYTRFSNLINILQISSNFDLTVLSALFEIMQSSTTKQQDAPPPSYYDVTGISSCERLHPESSEGPNSSRTCTRQHSTPENVTLDIDSIQVTFQYTNPLCEQSNSSSSTEIPQVLPGLPSSNLYSGQHGQTAQVTTVSQNLPC